MVSDFEWDPATQTMLCATFSDEKGNKVQKHIEDFSVGGEEDLLRWIVDQFKSYKLTLDGTQRQRKIRMVKAALIVI
jgi:hypothetical protein